MTELQVMLVDYNFASEMAALFNTAMLIKLGIIYAVAIGGIYAMTRNN